MRKEPDIYTPSIGLVAKLGSIVVHVEEGLSADGHSFDLLALKALLTDPEVRGWREALARKGLVPVKRKV